MIAADKISLLFATFLTVFVTVGSLNAGEVDVLEVKVKQTGSDDLSKAPRKVVGGALETLGSESADVTREDVAAAKQALWRKRASQSVLNPKIRIASPGGGQKLGHSCKTESALPSIVEQVNYCIF